jgi:pimeloyl-ACP methyl ester carboxylesterase
LNFNLSRISLASHKNIVMKGFLVIVMLLLASTGVQAQLEFMKALDTTRYGKNPEAGRYLNSRGFKMYYEVYGQGDPLLIIHGNGGDINNFVFQIPYFSKKYKVILADSRAQGKSTDMGDSLSYEMMTDDLNALLDSLHVKDANVIGWSDGGINGLLLAIRHPDKVKKLAVTGANISPDATAIDPWGYKWALEMNNQADSMLRAGKLNAEMKNQRKVTHLLSYEPHISLAQLHSIKCPSLIIGGDHDVILPEHTALIARNIPQSYLWIIPNSGHSTPLYYRDDFNRVVDDFFSKPYHKISGEAVLQ